MMVYVCFSKSYNLYQGLHHTKEQKLSIMYEDFWVKHLKITGATLYDQFYEKLVSMVD